MNKFQTILNGVIEELSTSISMNPQQIEKDLERLPAQTKDVLQKIAKPLESGTEKNPNEDLMKNLEELDFEKLPTNQQEKLIKILTNKGFLKPNSTSTEKSEEDQKNTLTQQNNSNPASYGV
jgi:hypothetical protein